MSAKIYKVNQQYKKDLYQQYKKSRKWPTITNIILLMTIFLYALCSTAYIRMFHIDVLGACILISVFLALIIIWFIQKLLVRIAIGECFDNRINEHLEYGNSELVYRYQTKLGRCFDEWIELIIPLKYIDDITYRSDIDRVDVYGILHTIHYVRDSESCRKISDSHTFDTFTIFDYFEPSLSEVLHFKK